MLGAGLFVADGSRLGDCAAVVAAVAVETGEGVPATVGEPVDIGDWVDAGADEQATAATMVSGRIAVRRMIRTAIIDGRYSTSGELSITDRTPPKQSRAKRSPPPIRDATADEMRALAHPLRLRILRLTLERPMTNKELAERLGRDPGTVLHHVKVLVDGGFLAAESTRRGRRGAVERPYRSTGKSWQIRMQPSADHAASVLEAVRDEVLDGGPSSSLTTIRLGVRLKPDDLAALRAALHDVGDTFAPLDDPEGEPVGILALVHRRRP